LLVALLVALIAFSAFVAWRQSQLQEQQEVSIPFSTHSSRPNGASLLYQWLGAIGYRPERIENQDFEVRDEARLLFILGPDESFERAEVRQLLDWVARGNTLFVADDNLVIGNALL